MRARVSVLGFGFSTVIQLTQRFPFYSSFQSTRILYTVYANRNTVRYDEMISSRVCTKRNVLAPRYPATECPPGYRGAATTFTKLIKASARQRRKPPRHPFRACQKVVHVLRIVALRWSLCSEAQNLAPPASEKAKCRLPCPSARRPTRPSATPSRLISRSSTPLPMLRHRGSWP